MLKLKQKRQQENIRRNFLCQNYKILMRMFEVLEDRTGIPLKVGRDLAPQTFVFAVG